MELNDKDIKKIAILLLVLALAVLVFLLIRPIILSIIGGLILAYAFFPIYKIILKKVRSKNLAASLVSLFAIILILLPIYFLLPVIVDKVFGLFQDAMAVEVVEIIQVIFPSAPESFIVQMTATWGSIISKITSAILNLMINFLLELPTFLFDFIIVAFVFFFTLRDSDKLGEFVSAISPLNKAQENKLVQQFKDITNSIVYGQIVIGIVQGLIAGFGFFIFGIPHALLLTVLAVVFSIIPILGPFVVWVPTSIYLFSQGNTPRFLVYLIYNLFIVSLIDNYLRVYFVTKKTKLSQVIVLIGMVGGLFIFGILGLIIGPLLLAYFLTFLHAYKDNTLSSMFKIEKEPNA